MDETKTKFEADQTAIATGKKNRRKKLMLILRITIATSLIFIGPWPADNSSYSGSSYEKETLDAMEDTRALVSTGNPLFAGVAEIDITPPVGHPLAGYAGRDPMEADSVQSQCYARALTLKSGDVTVTILTADLLLVMGKLRDMILEKTGLSPAELYFTATHNHSGPGGFVDGLIEQLIMGSFDEAYRAKLASQLSEVISKSRESLTPVTFGSVQIDVEGKLKNRIDSSLPTYDRMTALVFTPAGATADKKPLAVLVCFAAHPTILRHKHRMISSEYPGVLVGRLRKKTGARHVLFAVGAVGDARPKYLDVADPEQRIELYGESLASAIAPHIEKIQHNPEPVVQTVSAEVNLPKTRIHLGLHFCLSRFITFLMTDRTTHISCLRIGDVVLTGMPGDYSGALARDLEKITTEKNLTLLLTSFNGDYKGYFVRHKDFTTYGKYETRAMNFYGPWGGEYLNHIAAIMIENKLKD